MASVLGKRKAASASTTKTSKPNATAASSKTASPALKKKKSAESLKKAGTTAATKKKKTVTAKTKAKKVVEKEEEEEDTSMLDAQEIFRRHFEAQFKPIEKAVPKKSKKSKAKAAEEKEEDSASGSDEDVQDGEEDIFEDEGADGEEGEGEEWSGLSGDEEENYDEDSDIPYDYIDENPVIEVVDHTKSNAQPIVSMSKRELKAFMSSKPPSQIDPSPTSLTAAQTPEDPSDENDKSMLANDLALQRLLSESHLLARHAVTPFTNSSNSPASKSFSEGKLRQRQTDLRTQSLAGAQGVSGVKSIFVQEKMPMAFRKGIVASTAAREEKRRRTARENGIVLEREAPKKVAKQSGGRFGQRGLDGLDVGRMRGAELRLSERDVQNIEGGGGGRGGRGRRGGRGPGRGGGGRGGRGKR
ncbi:hypothetical protein CSAL01_04019 [Colletotrichum salicis]|uniref:Protein FAF1 n=1 Tax=Colletotrichum salicis TaxID=1209931 RepID=A0A135UVK3_9PEZI|nr:hypothetical protein CSAL01_04019 [Colletotrichum salicis]